MNEDKITDPAPLPEESPPPKKKKSCFGRIVKLALFLLVIWWFNNFTLKITKETIVSDKVKNKITVAVISDQHASAGPLAIPNEKIISKIKKINPDIVCVLGDMHSTDATDEEKQISMDLMTDIIDEGFRLYFVLGEHDDRTNRYVSKMEANGINVLDQESETIKIKDTAITLYGISNAWFSPSFDLKNEFDLNKDTYNILLAHIPRFDDYSDFGADLTVCGDTHGGIIQIPFLGPAYYDDTVLPELRYGSEKIYDKGLFRNEKGYMFITSGIGNYPVASRFNNRPEIGEIVIEPK
ncbi:MAG: metallophosphoesterase [Porcipelethomonas sp.]